MTKLKVLYTIILLALAPLASGQVVYDSVRVAVADGVTCPSSWTASTETVTTPDASISFMAPAINRRSRHPRLAALRQCGMAECG